MSIVAETLLDAAPQTLGAERHTLALTTRRVSGSDWDAIIGGFDEVCQEQMHAFAAVRWPGVAQEPVVFHRGSELVGGALVMIQPLPFGVGKIAVVKWAPMLAARDRPDADLLRRSMVKELMDEYAERRGMMLSVLLHAAPEAINQGYLDLRAQGFQRGSILMFPNRYMVNLRLDDVALRKSFAQKWRYHLNKSEKVGLDFRRAEPTEIDTFKTLYSAMSERKQFPDHSAYDTLDALMALEEPLRPELFFVREGQETVAGALIFKAGERAVYLYGATSDRALPIRAGYFLHYHAIRWLRDNTTARWYDLGGTDGFQGLHQFKKGMVGEQGIIRPVPPVLNFAAKPWARAVGNGAFAARDAFQHMRRYINELSSQKAKPDQEPHVWDEYLR